MSMQLTAIDGMGKVNTDFSTAGMKANDHMWVAEDFLSGPGVQSTTTDFVVTQNSPTAKNVLISSGVAYIPNSSWAKNNNSNTRYWRVVNDATITSPTFTDNASGNPRIDVVCIEIDTAVAPGDDGELAASIVVVAGTPAASPTAPATPANYYALANVAIANGYTAITNANITSVRTQSTLTSTISTPNQFTNNAILNSNFNIAQRNTTFTNPASASYTLDRWKWSFSLDGGTDPTLIISQQILTAGDIASSYHYARLNASAAGSSYGTNSFHHLIQLIERGTRMLCGLNRKVTVSFYARSSIASKKLGIRLSQNYGTGGSPSSSEVINGTNWTLTSTWTRYSYTFTTNTLVGKTFGTGDDDSLSLAFFSQWGATIATQVGASGAETFLGSGNIDIAQVMLSTGDQTLDYQPRLFSEEFQLCQRYYQKSYDSGFAGSNSANCMPWAPALTTNAISGYRYPVKMRTTPTTLIYTEAGTANKVTNIFGAEVGSSVTVSQTTAIGFRAVLDGATSFSVGSYYTYHFTSDAEM